MTRDKKRLAAVRKLPCADCRNPPPSQAAHSNFSEHGKGGKIKAHDQYTVPLCHECHMSFDQYRGLTRDEAVATFDSWLEWTNRMLSEADKTITF